MSALNIPDFAVDDDISRFARAISVVINEETERFRSSSEESAFVRSDLLTFKPFPESSCSFSIVMTNPKGDLEEIVVSADVVETKDGDRYGIGIAAPVFRDHDRGSSSGGRSVEVMYFVPSGDESKDFEEKLLFLERFSARLFSEMESVRMHCMKGARKRWWKKF